MILLYIILGLVAIGAAAVLYDMWRFTQAKRFAEHPTRIMLDAGGYVYIKNGKTYYEMPNGTDAVLDPNREYDLRPGSKDWVNLGKLQEKAFKEHLKAMNKTKREAAKAEKANMADIAKAVAHD